jgi:WD40 repeat protein
MHCGTVHCERYYNFASCKLGTADTTHKGAIHIYSFAHQPNTGAVELRKRADGCSTSAWINDLKFSPDGTLLLAGSHDKRLYAFDIPFSAPAGDLAGAGNHSRNNKPAVDDSQWAAWATCLNKEKYQFNKHSSAVLHVDFTADGRYFQTNCQAAELLFGYPDTGRQETSATKVADYNNDLGEAEDGVQWATQTCKLGWAVQGIWPPGSDMTDINAVDRSGDHKLLATADDFGHVKLFRFPCAQEHAKYSSFEGHSSHVTNLRWTISNQLVSVGGNDKCVFVWSKMEK